MQCRVSAFYSHDFFLRIYDLNVFFPALNQQLLNMPWPFVLQLKLAIWVAACFSTFNVKLFIVLKVCFVGSCTHILFPLYVFYLFLNIVLICEAFRERVSIIVFLFLCYWYFIASL